MNQPAGLAEQARQLAREALAEVAGFLHRCGASVLSVKSLGNLWEICWKSGGIWKKCPEISGFFRFMLKKKVYSKKFRAVFLTEGDIYFMNFHRFLFFFLEGVAGVEISDVKELTPQNSAEWICVFSPHIYIYSLSLSINIYIYNE